MQCNKDCKTCQKPHQINPNKWCYDAKFKLPSLIEGKERPMICGDRKEVLSFNTVYDAGFEGQVIDATSGDWSWNEDINEDINDIEA